MLYYNPEKAAKDEVDMNDYLTSLYNDLVNNTKKEYRLRDYDKFFTVTETPKRGRKVEPNEAVMLDAAKNYGYFALFIDKRSNGCLRETFYLSK